MISLSESFSLLTMSRCLCSVYISLFLDSFSFSRQSA